MEQDKPNSIKLARVASAGLQQKAIDLAPEKDKAIFRATLAKMQSNQSIR